MVTVGVLGLTTALVLAVVVFTNMKMGDRMSPHPLVERSPAECRHRVAKASLEAIVMMFT